MNAFLHFLLGSQTIRIDATAAGEVMNLCRAHAYVYWNLRFCGEQVCLDASPKTVEKLLSFCRDRDIFAETEPKRGLPSLLYRYRRRAGLAVGACLFAAILVCSGRVLWGIEIHGNYALSDAEVCSELRACGLVLGTPLSSLNTESLEHRVLIASDDISWISVNLVGTVAHVELREVEGRPIEAQDYDAANLVAAKSGTVELLEGVRGGVMVKPGDVVSEGELLVSGILDTADGGVRYRVAEGQIWARTEYEFLVEVPLRFEEKRLVKQKKVRKSLIFFEKEINFFTNSRNLPETCDTIEIVDTMGYFSLWDGRALPFGVRTVEVLEYELCPSVRDANAATELAFSILSERIVSEVPEGRLLRKRSEVTLTDEAAILRCRAELLEDIARIKEIEIDF